jgi:peptidoglycan/xylan/chitin deacetylase (PgdA/CDA1 family)
MNVPSHIFMRKFLFMLVALLVVAPAPPVFAAESAVVVMYHRFGESRYPSTNVTIEQFESHLAEIRDGGYTVLPLPELVKSVREGRPLADKTIAISIDDAFLSLYREAWPRLKKAGVPFTLFVATNPIDNSTGGYMNWDQIRELRDSGVTIGSQTASHPHMPLLSETRNKAELDKSNARFRKELGAVPTLIAYPYGEYSLAVGKVTRAAGFSAGFGQHSGVANATSDFFYLPRFAFNEAFGDLSRFRRAARALPVPATDVTPPDPFLGKGAANPPLFGFTVKGPFVKRLPGLACYAFHEGKLKIERLGERRIEVRMTKPFPAGRTRINCTMWAPGGRWHWFGRQFLVSKRR